MKWRRSVTKRCGIYSLPSRRAKLTSFRFIIQGNPSEPSFSVKLELYDKNIQNFDFLMKPPVVGLAELHAMYSWYKTSAFFHREKMIKQPDKWWQGSKLLFFRPIFRVARQKIDTFFFLLYIYLLSYSLTLHLTLYMQHVRITTKLAYPTYRYYGNYNSYTTYKTEEIAKNSLLTIFYGACLHCDITTLWTDILW